MSLLGVKKAVLVSSRAFSLKRFTVRASVAPFENKNIITLGSISAPLASASGVEQTLKQIFQIELNIVKNPNWSEANQLAIYKRG